MKMVSQDRFDILPLFAWAFSGARKGGRPKSVHARTKHCQSCGKIINRSSRRHCKGCANVGLRRAIPTDFLPMLEKLGSQEAAKHYSASLSTVTRWRREIGLKSQIRMRRALFRARMNNGFTQRPLLVIRDFSVAGQAADFLRRFGAVYRCAENGAPNSKGTHWKRNFSVLTDDEIVRRAERLGWTQAESW